MPRKLPFSLVLIGCFLVSGLSVSNAQTNYDVISADELNSALTNATANTAEGLQTTINIESPLLVSFDQFFVNGNVTINGNGNSIDMADQDRAFFIAGGNVSIANLTIENGAAHGGNGNDGGGGGAGLGGAIFVANGQGISGSGVNNATTVTLSGISFQNNSANGGNGGPQDTSNGAGSGGGGGMGGNGGGGSTSGSVFTYYGSGGGGGFGNGANGGASGGSAGNPGNSGSFIGGTSAASGFGDNGGASGGSNGGGGGGSETTFDAGGPPNGGGGGGLAGSGINGGFGGGGGGLVGKVSQAAGNGGFGGGGGSSDSAFAYGGNGGFGGGGGGGDEYGGGSGGFGGGNANTTQNVYQTSSGGGGLGAGGALFVMAGASLTVANSSFSGDSVSGGANSGSGSQNGQAIGNGMFLGATTIFSNNGTMTISENISGASLTADPSGNSQGGITTEGTGTLIVTGNNTYVGSTTVDHGTLMIGTTNSLPLASATTVNANGTLDLGGNSFNGILLTLNGGTIQDGTFAPNSNFISQGGAVAAIMTGNAGLVATTGTTIFKGANTYQGGTTIAANAIIQVGNGSTNGQLGSGGVQVNGTLMYDHSDTFTENNSFSGGGGIQQNGTGTLILAANSSFSGLTTVNSGTLLANNTSGSAVGTSTVLVNSATLGGNGLIGGATTIQNGGALVAGSGGAGSFSFTSGLTLASGSATTFLLNSTNNFTSINLLGGSVNYGGGLTFNIANYTPTTGNEFTVFNMTGGASESGDFSSIEVGSTFLTDNSGLWIGTNNGFAYQFSDSTGALTVTAVPEPSSWALLGLGITALLLMTRRRMA